MPASKSLQGPQNTALATKSTLQGSQGAAPATKLLQGPPTFHSRPARGWGVAVAESKQKSVGSESIISIEG